MKPWAVENWQQWGMDNPFFAVLSDPKYLIHNLNDTTRAEFFQTGEKQVDAIYSTIRAKLQSDFQPRRVLDFGCGVGRLVIPFAQRSDNVVGIDISQSMLNQAQENCAALGVQKNVYFVNVKDFDSLQGSSFDLVHSFIVFQHIRVREGEGLLRRLLGLIKPGGIGVIHLTFADIRPSLRRAVLAIRMRSTIMHRVFNLIQGHPFSWPLMPMNSYSLNRVFALLMESGCANLYVEFTNHGGFLGTVLYFQRK